MRSYIREPIIPLIVNLGTFPSLNDGQLYNDTISKAAWNIELLKKWRWTNLLLHRPSQSSFFSCYYWLFLLTYKSNIFQVELTGSIKFKTNGTSTARVYDVLMKVNLVRGLHQLRVLTAVKNMTMKMM